MLAVVKSISLFVICLTLCDMPHSKGHFVQAGKPFALVSSALTWFPVHPRGMSTWTAGPSSMLAAPLAVLSLAA